MFAKIYFKPLSRCNPTSFFLIKNKVRLKYLLLYVIYVYLFYFDEPWFINPWIYVIVFLKLLEVPFRSLKISRKDNKIWCSGWQTALTVSYCAECCLGLQSHHEVTYCMCLQQIHTIREGQTVSLSFAFFWFCQHVSLHSST